MDAPDYALARGREISVGIDSVHYDTVNRVDGDENITRDLIKGVANFLLKQIDNNEVKRALNQIKAMPLCLQQCELINKFILEHPGLMVVPKVVNYHEKSGLYVFCWERTLNINSAETIALIGEEGIAAMKRQGKIEIELLTISDAANQALQNVIANFNRPRPAPISYQPVQRLPTYTPTVRSPLVYNPYSPIKKERSCTCAIV